MLHDRRDAQCVTRHDDGAERRYRCFAGTRSRLAECRELRRLQLLPLLGGAIKSEREVAGARFLAQGKRTGVVRPIATYQCDGASLKVFSMSSSTRASSR